MRKYLKIDGNNNFVRDLKSHAVINTDKEELKRNLSDRKNKKQQKKDLETLKKDVEDMKSLLNLILEKIEK